MDYVSLLARSLDAEYHVEAFSGKGITQNAAKSLGFSGPITMPAYWGRTLPGDDNPTTVWNFTRWVPDLVVVLLGANDFTYNESPELDVFTARYTDMLRSIFHSYAAVSARIPVVVTLCGGGQVPTDCNMKACPYVNASTIAFKSTSRQFAEQLYFVTVPLHVLRDDKYWGCLDHRNTKGKQKFASYIEGPIREIMDWTDGSRAGPALLG